MGAADHAAARPGVYRNWMGATAPTVRPAVASLAAGRRQELLEQPSDPRLAHVRDQAAGEGEQHRQRHHQDDHHDRDGGEGEPLVGGQEAQRPGDVGAVPGPAVARAPPAVVVAMLPTRAAIRSMPVLSIVLAPVLGLVVTVRLTPAMPSVSYSTSTAPV